MPLTQFVPQTLEMAIQKLGLETPDAVVKKLGLRWQSSKLVMQPADPALQTKKVAPETFFYEVAILLKEEAPCFPKQITT